MIHTTLAKLNLASPAVFIQVLGNVFENARWPAEDIMEQRPFASVQSLHRALCESLRHAPELRRRALLQSYPDFGIDLRRQAMSPIMRRELCGAGFDRLSPTMQKNFRYLGFAYRSKFQFPFVISTRHRSTAAILSAFEGRLENDVESELRQAFDEIERTAAYRLTDIVVERRECLLPAPVPALAMGAMA